MPNPMVRSCSCPHEASRPARSGRVNPQRVRAVGFRGSPMLRETSVVRDRVAPHKPKGIKQIIIESGRTQCRPFNIVQKDPERFAACNALADKIGPLDDPEKVFGILRDAIGDEVNEVFGVLTLDIHTRLKGIFETGRGEPSSVMAPLMPTLQAALIDGADSVIIFHVHPSGVEAEPSDADIETTDAFFDAFETVGVPMLDHMIVGGDIKKRSYYSFLEDNAL